jgi:hypothetical protein
MAPLVPLRLELEPSEEPGEVQSCAVEERVVS